MSLLTVVPSLLEVGSKLIDKLIPDPQAKAKAQLDLLSLQQNGELKELETRMSAIVAEASSVDPWTSRARPSFLYVFYFVILSLTVVAPVIGVFNPLGMDLFFANVGKGFAALPEELWWTFSAGYLGYAGARTFEKRKGVA
tara:strand:+ start:1234 stop:1656 length:423 start_codon:yes stop_codon:yes gene_type:complete